MSIELDGLNVVLSGRAGGALEINRGTSQKFISSCLGPLEQPHLSCPCLVDRLAIPHHGPLLAGTAQDQFGTRGPELFSPNLCNN